METFFPNRRKTTERLLQLEKATQTLSAFKYRIDLDFKTAERFIDADTYFTDGDKLALAKLIVKKKWWQFLPIKWSITTVNFAEAAFLDFADELKPRFVWIYDPPILPTRQGLKPSMGAEYQKDFAQDYGGYMELAYLLTKGNFLLLDEVTKWPLERFLFQAEYLLRKKRIESI